jgi:hypothetical protein
MAGTDTPTAKQMALLRRLADERGQTFAYSRSRVEASQQIEQLRRAERSTRSERTEDRRAVGRRARQAADATSIRRDEVDGYGSSATWRGER